MFKWSVCILIASVIGIGPSPFISNLRGKFFSVCASGFQWMLEIPVERNACNEGLRDGSSQCNSSTASVGNVAHNETDQFVDRLCSEGSPSQGAGQQIGFEGVFFSPTGTVDELI